MIFHLHNIKKEEKKKAKNRKEEEKNHSRVDKALKRRFLNESLTFHAVEASQGGIGAWRDEEKYKNSFLYERKEKITLVKPLTYW